MTRRRPLALALLLAIAAPSASADAPAGVEQEFLWQVNLARHDPAAWAHANDLGAILDAFAPKPPLAWNATLVDSAQAKAQEFLDHAYFGHDSPVTGSPNNLVVNVFGYPLAANTGFYFGPGCDFGCSYSSFGNTAVESLAASGGPDGGLFATPVGAVRGLLGEICGSDGAIGSCGTVSHRNHLLAAATTPAPMLESGAGHSIRVTPQPGDDDVTHYWVFHTGFPAGSAATMPQLLTGVAYDDADGDGHYDAGEGLAGVTVQANALSTVTNAAGGWSIAVANGSHDVSCAGGLFAGTASASDVVVADANRQVDCVSGDPQARVDFAPEPDAASGIVAVLASFAALRRGARRLSLS